MPDPIAVILRFHGDADDLFDRFERARRLWIEEQEADHTPPAFYAACKTDDGIVIVTGWQTDVAHRAYGRTMSPYLELVGMRSPDQHEHLAIQRLGWDLMRSRGEGAPTRLAVALKLVSHHVRQLKAGGLQSWRARALRARREAGARRSSAAARVSAESHGTR